MSKIIIKASNTQSTNVIDMIQELANDHLDKCEQIAQFNNWALSDALEAVATFIVYNDEDYICEVN